MVCQNLGWWKTARTLGEAVCDFGRGCWVMPRQHLRALFSDSSSGCVCQSDLAAERWCFERIFDWVCHSHLTEKVQSNLASEGWCFERIWNQVCQSALGRLQRRDPQVDKKKCHQSCRRWIGWGQWTWSFLPFTPPRVSCGFDGGAFWSKMLWSNILTHWQWVEELCGSIEFIII